MPPRTRRACCRFRTRFSLVAERGRLTQELAAGGAMAAVLARHEVVAAEIARSEGALEIAAWNGPEHVVIAGPVSAVETAMAQSADGRRRIEAAAGELCGAFEPRHARASRLREDPQDSCIQIAALTLVSNVSGKIAGPDEMSRPEYWTSQIREPVRFTQAMETLAAQGVTHFIEIGPHPVLLGMGAHCHSRIGSCLVAVASSGPKRLAGSAGKSPEALC